MTGISAYRVVFTCGFIVAGLLGQAGNTSSGPLPPGAVQLTNADSETGKKITSSSGTFNEGPVTAFKNTAPSRMLKSGSSFDLMYTFPEAKVVNGYGIQAGGSYFAPDRGPRTWKIYGSNDYVPEGASGSVNEGAANEAATWVELDAREGEDGWQENTSGVENNDYRYYEFANPDAYRTYKIQVLANNGNNSSWTEWRYFEFCYLSSCSLVVAGVPEQIGTVTPAFGMMDMPTAATTLSSYDRYTNEVATIAQTCTGYRVYQKDSDEVWQVIDSGSANTFTLDPIPSVSTKVEWQYDASYLVSVEENVLGTVQGAGWYARGATARIVPVPNAGYRFVAWTGDVPEGHASDDPLVLEVTAPVKLTPLFLPEAADGLVQYVTPEGDDANDGFSWEAAKRTPAAAVAYISSFAQPGTVLLTNGTYRIKSTIELKDPIAVRGVSPNPRDVVIERDGSVLRLFRLDNAESLVANLTVTNGYVQQDQGSGVRIGANGGVLSNCVVTSCYAWNYYSGAAVLLEGERALVTHCEITDNSINQDHEGKGVVAVDVLKGRLENSLIHDNYSASAGFAIVRANGAGASVVNCTIVDNYAKTAVGLHAKDGSVIRNTVVYNCRKDGETTAAEDRLISPWLWNGKTPAFDHCARDGEESVETTCQLVTAADFRDYANGDFCPTKNGSIFNKGVTPDGWGGLVDFAGKPRVRGSRIDIGCFEAGASGIRLIVR